jgi:hypothetical protein
MPAERSDMVHVRRTIEEMSQAQLTEVAEWYRLRVRELAREGAGDFRRRQWVEFTDRQSYRVRGRIKTVNEKTVTLEQCQRQMFGGWTGCYANGIRVPFAMLTASEEPVATTTVRTVLTERVVAVGPQDGDEDRL